MRKISSFCFALILYVGALQAVMGEPVINEFMADNLSVAPDNCDFDDYSDWIELYNPATTNVSLNNYFLTDNLTEPFKWLVPTNAVIVANGYLMFRADGYDAAPGETHNRIYWPWISTFVTRRYHTGFKLSAAGEELGLYRTELPPQDVTLIAKGAVWKYRDTGTDPGTNWMTLTYDDSGWSQGPAQLGYGDGDEATVVSYGPSSNNKYATTHFRHHFNVTDPSRLGNIRFTALVDDGAIFYLNGQEAARIRMQAGAVGYQDYTTMGGSDYGFETVEIDGSLLRAGDNVLAVEVHQAAPNSSDISLDVQLIASEITGPAILVDSVTFGLQTTDVSYGRDPNSTNGWSFFGSPTPGGTNDTEALTQLTPAPAVSASLDSGFYTGSQSVSLSSAGTTIRYTLDGSVPGVASPVYSSALTIATNTVLRARAFVSGLIPGPVLTRSYFVDEPVDRTLAVMSFVVEPSALFDPVTGIYTNETPYPYKGREVGARVEFFETNRAPAFAVSTGIRIGGENNWRFAEKPLNIHMRGKYGDDFIGWQVFPGEADGSFTSLNVRNGGDNWPNAMLRDAMMAPILRGQSDNDLYSYRPCVVFLNGRYWGIHNIRKQFDPMYFANEHQLAADTYDLVQYAHNEIGVTTLMADTGNTDSYEAFHTFYTTHDLSQPTNYATMLAQMDVDSFIDYVVTEDFGVNTSWPWNREFWCARAPGSKWQWTLPDFDRCFFNANVTGSLIDDFHNSYPLFTALQANTNFVNRLLQRYAAHLGSTLYSNRVSTILNTLSAEVDGEMPRHIARWAAEGGIQSLASRQAQLNEIKNFAIARPAHAVSQLQSQLGLNRGLASLAVTVSPAAGGKVRIAGVPMTPEFNTTVSLFKNTPVEITAEAAPGYAFSGWSNGDTNPTIELTLTGAASLTANFQASAETLLPASITTDTTLTAANSPYTVSGDLIVESNVTLTVEAGVKFLMPPAASIYVYGAMQVNGTSNAPVQLLARSGQLWGNLCFVNASGSSVLSHLTVRGASTSRLDPVNLKGAVAGYNSALTLDGADIEALLPVTARLGTTTVRNSRLHVLFTGDCINLKNGTGLVENCTLTGNAAPDVDGIDFDSVNGGTIRGNRLYAFNSINGDAVDLGYSENVLVISNRIINVYDKGISVGQGTTVHVQRNLIVNCGLGLGIKDAGSTAYLDQNTFARDTVGVAVYVKVVGRGGGTAFITNCIFSRCQDAPVTADALSFLSVNYSLSDTLALPGTGNLLTDPLFTDAGNYDFSLTATSPAIDAGDPAHALDPDLSRADMGAYYTYNTNDYPYLVPNIVVINEVLAHSHDVAPDWIELHNNSAKDLNIGGWYLSDDPKTPEKFRIADGTILPANGYIVFYEDTDFGVASTNAGALIPFGLSENGDSVNLFGPTDGLRPDYNEREDFGASVRNVSFGRYYKASTRTYNFILMAAPTPGAPNSEPLVGPVVISEIMYHPPVGDAEYLELANITATNVVLYDADTATPWKMTQGITYEFPAAPPITLAPGEKILLVRDSAVFATNYTPAPGTRVFQWTSGGLDNNGETLEISKPGDTNSVGERQYVRVDRVDFTDSAPWPTGPDGSGTSLTRINEQAYGNDFANWAEASPTPGQTGFQKWAADQGLPAGVNGPNDDPDGDHLSNLMEYALGTNPLVPSNDIWNVAKQGEGIRVAFTVRADHADLEYKIQKATDLNLANWADLGGSLEPGAGATREFSVLDDSHGNEGFYRLSIRLFNQ